MRWACGLGDERVWALEDCRHVSGSLERFLIERGERVLRVHSKLMSASRREARGRGKSDSIDALSVARAALREGLDALPARQCGWQAQAALTPSRPEAEAHQPVVKPAAASNAA
jgi:hypothetical protein